MMKKKSYKKEEKKYDEEEKQNWNILKNVSEFHGFFYFVT